MKTELKNTEYRKGNCYECEGSIEFPTWAINEEIICPHCRKVIILGSCYEKKEPITVPTQLDKANREIERLQNQVKQMEQTKHQVVNTNGQCVNQQMLDQLQKSNGNLAMIRFGLGAFVFVIFVVPLLLSLF